MSVPCSTAEPRRSRLSIAMRGFLARMCQGACGVKEWLCGDCQRRPRSHNKEGHMKSDGKEVKQDSKTLLLLEVTGVIIAYIAIIASLAYPVVTAASRGA